MMPHVFRWLELFLREVGNELTMLMTQGPEFGIGESRIATAAA